MLRCLLDGQFVKCHRATTDRAAADAATKNKEVFGFLGYVAWLVLFLLLVGLFGAVN